MDPSNAKFKNEIQRDSRQDKTKQHYVSSLRQWVIYCLDIQQNPIHMPIDAELIEYWICDRTQEIGTIKSLNTWISMLLWLSECFMSKSPWHIDPLFIKFIKESLSYI